MEFLKLNNGIEMPILGLGTYLLSPDDAERAVNFALANGYSLIDTANAYVNERAVGRGMKASGKARNEIFLETKLWASFYEDDTQIDKTLERLGTDYIDLMILHQPAGNYIAGYHKLEKAYKEGKLNAIGVSNFEIDELKQILQAEVGKLDDAHIAVRNHWPAVDKFRKPETWQYISEVDVLDLKNEVAPLLPKSLENELAKKFDLLSLYVQLGLVDENFDSGRHEGQITRIADALRKRATIPDIQAKMPLLNEVMTSAFWDNKTIASIENMRRELRDLMKYLVSDGGKTFTVTIEDDVTDGGVAPKINTDVSYREKLLDFLTQHRDHPVLQKIHNLEYLSSEDIDELERILWQELGSKEDYERYLKREKMTADIPVAAFIRKIVGLDRQKAIALFTEFISANTLTAGQEEFINNILNYVCQNGDMEKNVFRDNRIFRESLLKYFPNKAAQVAKFVAMLHDAITAA